MHRCRGFTAYRWRTVIKQADITELVTYHFCQTAYRPIVLDEKLRAVFLR